MVLMDYIREFLSRPDLPDIIGYLLIAITAIFQAFMKAFIKKDNAKTLFKVDKKIVEVLADKTQMKEATKELQEARKEIKELKKEVATMKGVIKTISSNSAELVKKGVARDVAKELNNSENIVEDTKGEIENGNN